MNKKYIMLLTCFLLIISFTIIIVVSHSKLLTGNKNEIAEIIITINPASNPREITIDSKEKINKIINLLNETENIKTKKHPNHSESMQNDSLYILRIFYMNDNVDIIQTAENKEYIYRLLDTKGSSMDSGYIIGKNPKLWSYISVLN